MKSINEKSVYGKTHVFEMLKELLNIRGKLFLSVHFVQDEQEKPTCFSELDYSLPVYFVHFTVPQNKGEKKSTCDCKDRTLPRG